MEEKENRKDWMEMLIENRKRNPSIYLPTVDS
jgi:hypothetical protein